MNTPDQTRLLTMLGVVLAAATLTPIGAAIVLAFLLGWLANSKSTP